MGEKEERKEKKKHRKEKDGKVKRSKKDKKTTTEESETTFSLLADKGGLDPTLSSLFAAKPTPPVRLTQVSKAASKRALPSEDDDRESDEEADVEIEHVNHEAKADEDVDQLNDSAAIVEQSGDIASDRPRKRRRKHQDEEIEDVYMRRLAKEEAKEAEAAAAERAAKRQKKSNASENSEDHNGEARSPDDDKLDDDEDEMSPPPLHETQTQGQPDHELEKASRTVFLGNVSTSAITSKTSRKVLLDHLKTIFTSVTKSKPDPAQQPKLESIRFRSTPYAASIPKKAAFAKKELMDATAKSTNAYVVYSSPALARLAVAKLNGTIVLDRHLRVDSVAHPAVIDHKRCVFVGNLGFVSDESNINAANEHENRKPAKQPADVEEGLWRTFGKCGIVESVRVIRDATTRVGKGIAYVQFADQNAVEAALLLNEKKFPPMLPRKLRVSRAKAVKRNSTKSGVNGTPQKESGRVAPRLGGRMGKLLGRAGAAQQKWRPDRGEKNTNKIKMPEDFVFEGHRASSKSGKGGLKLGKKKGSKPTNRSAKRGTAFKIGKKKQQ